MTKSFEQLKMFVVGEIGVNWDGDFELLKDMMSQLKNLGLDAVKFQSFTHDMIKNHPESSRLFQSSITKDNVEKIHKISSDVEIEWFCTPMYPEAVSFLDPFVSRYKIRELDGRKIIQNLNSEILNSILRETKYTLENTKGINHKFRLCILEEFLLRINDYNKVDNKRWFLTPIEAALINIESI